MRIHLVSEHASPLALLGGVDAGGQNVHVAALATGLAAQGAEVVVHTRRDDPALPRRVWFAPGVVVDHVDAGPASPLPKDALVEHMPAFAADLRAEWSLQRPDVVHAHFWMSGLAAVQAAESLDIPVAMTFHALGIEKRRHQGCSDTSPVERVQHERWLAGAADHVIATTDAERRALLAMGAAPERVSVIPCGVDLDHFVPAWPPRGQRSRPIVLCLSRLVPRKGIEDVVRAITRVPEVQLVVAGGPPAAMLCEDAEAARLRTLAHDLGVADRVELIGAVDRADAPDLIRSSDVVCCTPWYEPFGLVAVEAMACGVPVVATAVGGLAETVQHGRSGVLVPPRRPDDIGDAIASVVRHPAFAASLRAGASRRAQEYGWTRVAEQTLDVVRRLAAGRRNGARPSALGGRTIVRHSTIGGGTAVAGTGGGGS